MAPNCLLFWVWWKKGQSDNLGSDQGQQSFVWQLLEVHWEQEPFLFHYLFLLWFSSWNFFPSQKLEFADNVVEQKTTAWPLRWVCEEFVAMSSDSTKSHYQCLLRGSIFFKMWMFSLKKTFIDQSKFPTLVSTFLCLRTPEGCSWP